MGASVKCCAAQRPDGHEFYPGDNDSSILPGYFTSTEETEGGHVPSKCTAFAGSKRIASGPPEQVVLAVKAALDANKENELLVFDDINGGLMDFDLRGTPDEILARLVTEPAPVRPDEPVRGPGRPKLGVVAREVTLLPRHWDWLNAQPGGASVALRKLVETARVTRAGADRRRLAQQSADRFMAAVAGNEPGYEEASRALYCGDRMRFEEAMAAWPADVRSYALHLSTAAFDGDEDE
jgi:uncharacterized protein